MTATAAPAPVHVEVDVLTFGEAKEQLLLASESRSIRRGGWASYLWGPPGVGKSALMREVAEDQSLGMVDLRMSLLMPSDIRGIPHGSRERMSAQQVADRVAEYEAGGFSREEAIRIACTNLETSTGTADWWAPAFLPKTPGWIIFLDELNAAPPAIQASAYQLVLDGRVGEYSVPDDCFICGAGNRETDQALVYTMPSPLANRFTHIELAVNFQEWKKWAMVKGIDSRVISYLAFRPDKLYEFNPKVHKRAFCTPRSWERVSDILRLAIKKGMSVERIGGLINGSVGGAARMEFESFCKIAAELPNVEDLVVRGNMNIALPSRKDVLFAFCGAIVGCIREIKEANAMAKAFNYFCKFAVLKMKSNPEFAALVMHDLLLLPTFRKNASVVAYKSPDYVAFDHAFKAYFQS